MKAFLSTLVLFGATFACTTFDIKQADARAAASDASMRALRLKAIANNTSFLQQRDPDGCIGVAHSFLQYSEHSGYDNLIGVQGAGPNGYRLFSPTSDINDPNTESRLRYDFTFNDGNSKFTNIWVTMRGAPDTGKNSNAVLRENRCALGPLDANGNHIHDCDEIDIVEMYGGGNKDAEFTYYLGSGQYQPNQQPVLQNHGTYTGTTGGAAGQNFFIYSVYLERGQYLRFAITYYDGTPIATATYTSGVPAKPLDFFAGEYNCAASGSGADKYCGDPFSGGTSYMEIADIIYQTC